MGKMMESTIVPCELRRKYQTVSEALLELTENHIGHLRLNAPLVCMPSQRIIVPLSPVVTLKENPFVGIREHVLNDLIKSDKSHVATKLRGLFPPRGSVGFWDIDERIYRTRYFEKSALVKPQISKKLVEKKKLQDTFSFWNAVKTGEIIPFLETAIDLKPDDLEKPWLFDFVYANKYNSLKFTLSVAYRGCSQIYDYPFRPSSLSSSIR